MLHVRLWFHSNTILQFGSRKNDGNELELLHQHQLGERPINCFDWSPDRIGLAVCGSFDQMVQVLVSANLPLSSNYST